MQLKTQKNIKTAAYWLTTGLLALNFAIGGVFQILRGPEVMRGMAHLGYPAYFITLLGVWKILGSIAVLVPGFGRLKEWAYAGIFFDLTGAAVSILAVGDGVGAALMPLVFVAFEVTSYLLRSQVRPASVALPGQRARSMADVVT